MQSYSDTTNNHVLVCISVVFSFMCFFKFYIEFSMILSHIFTGDYPPQTHRWLQ